MRSRVQIIPNEVAEFRNLLSNGLLLQQLEHTKCKPWEDRHRVREKLELRIPAKEGNLLLIHDRLKREIHDHRLS